MMLKTGSRVKVLKLAESDEPEYPAADPEKYAYGHENSKTSTPVDYWFTGKLAWLPEVGRHLVVCRDSRNGVPVKGMFISSKVIGVRFVNFYGAEPYTLVETCNSIYEICIVKDEDEQDAEA